MHHQVLQPATFHRDKELFIPGSKHVVWAGFFDHDLMGWHVVRLGGFIPEPQKVKWFEFAMKLGQCTNIICMSSFFCRPLQSVWILLCWSWWKGTVKETVSTKVKSTSKSHSNKLKDLDDSHKIRLDFGQSTHTHVTYVYMHAYYICISIYLEGVFA